MLNNRDKLRGSVLFPISLENTQQITEEDFKKSVEANDFKSAFNVFKLLKEDTALKIIQDLTLEEKKEFLNIAFEFTVLSKIKSFLYEKAKHRGITISEGLLTFKNSSDDFMSTTKTDSGFQINLGINLTPEDFIDLSKSLNTNEVGKTFSFDLNLSGEKNLKALSFQFSIGNIVIEDALVSADGKLIFEV